MSSWWWTHLLAFSHFSLDFCGYIHQLLWSHFKPSLNRQKPAKKSISRIGYGFWLKTGMLNGVLKPYVGIHYDEWQSRITNIVLSPLFSVVASGYDQEYGTHQRFPHSSGHHFVLKPLVASHEPNRLCSWWYSHKVLCGRPSSILEQTKGVPCVKEVCIWSRPTKPPTTPHPPRCPTFCHSGPYGLWPGGDDEARYSNWPVEYWVSSMFILKVPLGAIECGRYHGLHDFIADHGRKGWILVVLPFLVTICLMGGQCTA